MRHGDTGAEWSNRLHVLVDRCGGMVRGVLVDDADGDAPGSFVNAPGDEVPGSWSIVKSEDSSMAGLRQPIEHNVAVWSGVDVYVEEKK